MCARSQVRIQQRARQVGLAMALALDQKAHLRHLRFLCVLVQLEPGIELVTEPAEWREGEGKQSLLVCSRSTGSRARCFSR